MARRSSILDLPEDLRTELNARLVKSGFRDYQGFEDWLNAELEKRDLEVRISRSAIHRHGQQFEEKLEKLRMATEQAKAISEGAQDDEGAMNEALIRLVQQNAFDLLLALDKEGDVSPTALNKIGVMVSRLVRASVRQKEWMMEARQQLEARKQVAAEQVEKIAKGKGLSKDVANAIRAEILGIDLHG